jgi:hypothetical protein
MPEPVALTAGAIASLAFQKFLDSGAGELGKQMTGEALAQLKTLHQKVVDRLRGRSTKVDEALVLVEQRDAAALETLAKNLDVVMDEDEDFAVELRELVGAMVYNRALPERGMQIQAGDQIGMLQQGNLTIERQVNVSQSGTENTQNNTFTL